MSDKVQASNFHLPSSEFYLAVSFTRDLKNSHYCFHSEWMDQQSLRAASSHFPVNPIHASSTAMRAEQRLAPPPALSSRYKALPPSVHLRPKFRKSVWGERSESLSHERGRGHIGERCFHLFSFVLSRNPWFLSTFFFSDVDYLELTRLD